MTIMIFKIAESTPDRCHPGVTLDLLYSEWFFIWSSDPVVVEWNWDIRVESSVEWIALQGDFSRYILLYFEFL